MKFDKHILSWKYICILRDHFIQMYLGRSHPVTEVKKISFYNNKKYRGQHLGTKIKILRIILVFFIIL